MRKLSSATLLIALASVLLPNTILTPTFNAIAASPIYWGANLYQKPPDAANFQPGGAYYNFETNISKKKLSIISWGAPWEYPTGTWLKFQKVYFDNVRNHGSIPLLTWGSWYCCAMIESKYALRNITHGNFDSFIRQWATDAKAWGHPFFLRFDHEMNGDWQFPWSALLNTNSPADYIAAWRHVHDIFKAVGATNVVWVWCPNIGSTKTVPMAQVYPGDAYVDWLCLDGYNWGVQKAMPWLSFSQLYSGAPTIVKDLKNSYAEITALSSTKPLMIGEFASIEAGDGGAKKAAWITSALTQEIPVKYPRIRAIVWFNVSYTNLPWPVESSAASAQAFAAAIKLSIYATNTFGTITTIAH